MNLKSFFSFILILWCSLGAMAQKYAVSGSIIAADTRETLPQVNVQLLAKDSTRVTATNTNDKGGFQLQAKAAGEYIVIARLIGFEPLVRNVKLTSAKPTIKLGTLTMKPATQELDELNVSALARMMTMKDDTIIFNSAALRLPPNASLALMMKQLPGIGVDKDGNMTYQGKVVNEILVDGKPFFGDVNTALANMPTDAVQNLKVYEKTDEEKEFRGELDTDKATVVDLTIKEEYKSKWIANANLGGGTDKRYIGKVFATNFTDRRRTAVFVQMNNISQNQQVDDNGNWYYWSTGAYGLYDYRKVGTIMQWDNGKKNTESGNMRGNASIDLQHDNSSFITEQNQESFLGGGNTQYSYGHNESANRYLRGNANIDLTYNINKNNRMNLWARYNYSDNKGNGFGHNSVFNSKPSDADNLASSLTGQDIPDEMKQMGVYSYEGENDSKSNGHSLNANLSYTHIFKKEGRSLNADLNGSYNYNDSWSNSRQLYRYFDINAPQPELLDRKRTVANNSSYRFSGSVSYNEPLSQYIKLGANYGFTLNNSDNTSDLFNVHTIPLALRPTPGDSLQFVTDLQNSYFSDTHSFNQNVGINLQGVWDKVEMSLSPKANVISERLIYDRGGEHYDPSRTYLDYGGHASLRYKFTSQKYIEAGYNGSTSRRSLMDQLPIRDTSNPMVENVNNPNLKDGWQNSWNLSGRIFNQKRGDSYYAGIYFNNSTNSVVTTEQVDPVTGYRRYSKMNVNGNYNITAYASTDQPLDTMRHWNLNASLSFGHSHRIGYVGSMGNSLGLSSINSYSANTRVSLRYRKDIWSMSLSGMYNGDFSRYVETPQYNQDGHTYEVIFSPQVDLPFGMKINSSFIYYARSGYADPLLNHPQWIINAAISQTFLKSKALTIQLEGTDLLKSRTAETSNISPTSRSYSRTDTFLSYVMLHATYRFNL